MSHLWWNIYFGRSWWWEKTRICLNVSFLWQITFNKSMKGIYFVKSFSSQWLYEKITWRSFQTFSQNFFNTSLEINSLFFKEHQSLNFRQPHVTLGIPGGACGKESTCQFRRCLRQGFNPWVRTISWRRAWQPTPVFLLIESHGYRSLASYSP